MTTTSLIATTMIEERKVEEKKNVVCVKKHRKGAHI